MKFNIYMHRALIIFGLVISVLFTGRILLNLSGFCFKDRRFLSNQEKINIAIMHIVNSYPPVIDMFVENNGILEQIDRSTPSRPIYYKGIDDFLSDNPDCCSLTNSMKESGYSIRFEHRLTGSANTFVMIKYKVKYIDMNDVERVTMKTRYVAISNCGHPWSGI